ncbi:MAG: histidine kinase [Pseudomonadota bacterium]
MSQAGPMVSPETPPSGIYPLPRMAKSYGITTVFCISIALLLWVLGSSDLYWGMVISFCIGYSICTAFAFGHGYLNRFVSPYLTPIPLQIGGLALGLLLAGQILTGDPAHFIVGNFSVLVLGIFFGVVVYAFSSSRARLADYRAALAQARQLEAEQAQALANTELKLLQAQIEPHFLFNTLSNATSLVHSDPDAAETMLVHLTRLLRRSLQRTRAEETTLAEEREVLEAYLGIAGIRMGERLRYEIDVPAVLASVPLPPLLLQPLVENAIEHGLEPKVDGGTVTIRARATTDKLHLTVMDNGLGLEAAVAPATARGSQRGTGLRNIRERLAAHYGQEGALQLKAASGGGTEALITLPLPQDKGE